MTTAYCPFLKRCSRFKSEHKFDKMVNVVKQSMLSPPPNAIRGQLYPFGRFSSFYAPNTFFSVVKIRELVKLFNIELL